MDAHTSAHVPHVVWLVPYCPLHLRCEVTYFEAALTLLAAADVMSTGRTGTLHLGLIPLFSRRAPKCREMSRKIGLATSAGNELAIYLQVAVTGRPDGARRGGGASGRRGASQRVEV